MTPLPSLGTCQIHSVRSGDDLEKLSLLYYRDKKYWVYLWKYNVDMYFLGQAPMCIMTPRFIVPGMNIYIPPLQEMQDVAPIKKEMWEEGWLGDPFGSQTERRNPFDPFYLKKPSSRDLSAPPYGQQRPATRDPFAPPLQQLDKRWHKGLFARIPKIVYQ
jgi:hypothetical protein